MAIVTRESRFVVSADSLLATADDLVALQADLADEAAERTMLASRAALTNLAEQNRELRAALIITGGELQETRRLHAAERSSSAARIATLESELRRAMGRLETGHRARQNALVEDYRKAELRAVGRLHRKVHELKGHEDGLSTEPAGSLEEICSRVHALDEKWAAVRLATAAVSPMQYADHARLPIYGPTFDAMKNYMGFSK